MKNIIIALLFVSACTHGGRNRNSCSSLQECSDLASRITSKSYIYTGRSLNGDVTNIGNVSWSKENADFLFGQILAGNGYARIKTNDPTIYQIIEARDIRYSAYLPSYSATKLDNDEMLTPNSADWGELIYKTSNGSMRVLEIARNIRPFLSRYGRVIDNRYSALIIVRDNLANLHQVLPLIRKMDVELTKKEIAEFEKSYKLEELREKTRKEMAARMKEFLNEKKK